MPPSGTFTAVAAGTEHTCGLRTNGQVGVLGIEQVGAGVASGGHVHLAQRQCKRELWSAHQRDRRVLGHGSGSPPAGRFDSVSAGGPHGCGTSPSAGSSAGAEGRNEFGELRVPETSRASRLATPTAAAWWTRANLRPACCWAAHDAGVRMLRGQSSPPQPGGTGASQVRFTGIDAGGDTELRARPDQVLGRPGRPPAVRISRIGCRSWRGHRGPVRAGTRAQTILCWGGALVPPPGAFTTVSVGRTVCGLRTDQTIACASNGATPPPGQFKSLSVAGNGGCAIRLNDRVAYYWGEADIAESPPGIFTAVVANRFHACALRRNGTAFCWGQNGAGEASPPPLGFTSLAVGRTNSCGVLKSTSEALCWGANSAHQSSPPSGQFESIALGDRAACGIRMDQTVTCWGEQTTATPCRGRSPRSACPGSGGARWVTA